MAISGKGSSIDFSRMVEKELFLIKKKQAGCNLGRF
jgi:hypothetical protein